MYALGIAVILLFAGGLYLYYDMVPAMPCTSASCTT